MNPKEYGLKYGLKLLSWLEMDASAKCQVTKFGIELLTTSGKTEQEAIDKAIEYIQCTYGSHVNYEYIIEYQLEGDVGIRRSNLYYESAEEFIASNPEVVYACEDVTSKREI